MSDLKMYIDHLERQMNSCRDGRFVEPENKIQKMSNAKKQSRYKNTKEKRDSAKKFLNKLSEE
jgi:hypothetical protein